MSGYIPVVFMKKVTNYSLVPSFTYDDFISTRFPALHPQGGRSSAFC